jgi:hypothetical protein
MRRTTTRTGIVAALMIGCGWIAPAQADDIIVSNVGQTNNGYATFTDQAQQFTTGATPATEPLLSVTLLLQGSSVTDTVYLDADSSNSPGSHLVSLGTVTPNSTGTYTLTPLTPFTLRANTTYWIEVDAPTGNAGNWGFTASTSYSGSGTLGSLALFNPSIGWTVLGLSEGPYQLQVVGGPANAVPEPASAVLAAFGAITFGAYGWCRRRREQRR